MYTLEEIKTGDVMVFESRLSFQLFFVHNVDLNRRVLSMSGVQVKPVPYPFKKSWGWIVSRKASEEEKELFFLSIEKNGYKFNRNNGVMKNVNRV